MLKYKNKPDLVIKKLKANLSILKKKYEGDNQKKYELIKNFWYLDRTNNLIYLKELIDNLTNDEITEINEESKKYSKDYILEFFKSSVRKKFLCSDDDQ